MIQSFQVLLSLASGNACKPPSLFPLFQNFLALLRTDRCRAFPGSNIVYWAVFLVISESAAKLSGRYI